MAACSQKGFGGSDISLQRRNFAIVATPKSQSGGCLWLEVQVNPTYGELRTHVMGLQEIQKMRSFLTAFSLETMGNTMAVKKRLLAHIDKQIVERNSGAMVPQNVAQIMRDQGWKPVPGSTGRKLNIRTLASLPEAYVGRQYRFELWARDGQLPYSWGVQDLPSWAEFDDGTGLLGGTPRIEDAGQEFSFTGIVTDSAGAQASRIFTVRVAEAPAVQPIAALAAPIPPLQPEPAPTTPPVTPAATVVKVTTPKDPVRPEPERVVVRRGSDWGAFALPLAVLLLILGLAVLGYLWNRGIVGPAVITQVVAAPTPGFVSGGAGAPAATPTAQAPAATPTQVVATAATPTQVPQPATPTLVPVATPTQVVVVAPTLAPVVAPTLVPTIVPVVATAAPAPALAGLVPNGTNPQTDGNGVCTDNAWIATQVGLQVVDVRSVGYVQGDGWADNCVWDSTGNTAGPKTVLCELPDLRCTLRFSDGRVAVYRGEAGQSHSNVTSYTFRYLPRYPTNSPFHNECFLLRFDQDYGNSRNPAYPTEPGNFDCSQKPNYVAGEALSLVAPSDRGEVSCSSPEAGVFVCSASRQVTITHPGGKVTIDVWPSYKEPEGCTGEVVENGTTKRISCSLPAELFADNWTVRE